MNFRFLVVVALVGAMAIPGLAAAAMSSANYRITTTVMSGGGGTMTSASYRLSGTLGQPSPLVDPYDIPGSASYDLLTGFWYTLGAGIGCAWDDNGDGDVDGSDLAVFIDIFDMADVGAFAAEFGRADCLP
jgi:hypothetical protein